MSKIEDRINKLNDLKIDVWNLLKANCNDEEIEIMGVCYSEKQAKEWAIENNAKYSHCTAFDYQCFQPLPNPPQTK